MTEGLLSLLAAGILVWFAAADPHSDCRGEVRAPRLDHVVVAVRDLDSAATRFESLGFRLKPGRPHANGLLNRHIKLRDGTELELMTVSGRPLDRMAREYAGRLETGEGGVYAALVIRDLDQVAAAADCAGLQTRRSSLGPWRFVSFPAGSDAGAIFFGSGWKGARDPDSILAHANGARTSRPAASKRAEVRQLTGFSLIFR